MNEANLITAVANKEAWHCSRSQETDSEETRLILWHEIWPSLSLAERRGNSQIVAVFLDRLLEQAVFDDEGAWVVAKAESHWLPAAETERRTESNLLH